MTASIDLRFLFASDNARYSNLLGGLPAEAEATEVTVGGLPGIGFDRGTLPRGGRL